MRLKCDDNALFRVFSAKCCERCANFCRVVRIIIIHDRTIFSFSLCIQGGAMCRGTFERVIGILRKTAARARRARLLHSFRYAPPVLVISAHALLCNHQSCAVHQPSAGFTFLSFGLQIIYPFFGTFARKLVKCLLYILKCPVIIQMIVIYIRNHKNMRR